MSSATLGIAVLSIAAATTLAYTDESAAAPPEKVEGVYTLSFAYGVEGLVLIGHVEDLSDNPATDGFVKLQYCVFKGVPEPELACAPSSACLDGSGVWRTLRFGRGIPVLPNGDALGSFGLVPLELNTIGFRGTYIKGSEIEDGIIEPKDWIRQ